MHKVKGAEQMSEKATPRGKPGRPRVNIPESDSVRTSTTINATRTDRRRIDNLKELYGFTTGGAAVRWAIRAQLAVLQLNGYEDTDADGEVREHHDTHTFTLWLNENEREQIDKVRKGYHMDSYVDAIRYSLRMEAERVGV